MCSKTSTGKSTPDFSAQIEKLKQALKNADAVLIGAGAGLSTSAGFTYSGARFETYFSDFAAKYGFSDMYTGGFYPFPTREEFWAYWSRYIFINRYQDAPKPVYNDLLKLVQKKAYFVITTNVDHCFQKAGFDKQRLFYSTHRATTACSSAPNRAVRKHGTTKRSSAKWCAGRKPCASPPSSFPPARTAAKPQR